MEKNEKSTDIFRISHQLFLSQGYEATTIRQISDQAGVSLGLTNHFFSSKESLACLVLNMVSAYTALFTSVSHPCQDPLRRTVLASRIRILYLLKSSYRRFYIDILKHDLLFSRLDKTPSQILCRLADLYHFPADEDLLLFYGNYVPYNYEKTLVLGLEAGLFSTIPAEDIPDYITIGTFEHFLDQAIINEALSEARQASETILGRMPLQVPEDFMLNFLREDQASEK